MNADTVRIERHSWHCGAACQVVSGLPDHQRDYLGETGVVVATARGLDDETPCLLVRLKRVREEIWVAESDCIPL